MKITRKQLRRIIRESLLKEGMPEYFRSDEEDEEPDREDLASYDRGYQDGLDGFPIADGADTSYDAGYEDGLLDAQLPEQGPPPSPEESAEEEMRYAADRPWEHN